MKNSNTEEIQILQRKVEHIEKQLNLLLQQKDSMKLDKHLYSVPEVAQMLGRTPQAIYAMINRGELEATKIGSIKILGSCLRKIMKKGSE